MNWQIIGHQKITSYLENTLLNGRLAHAFLFYGQKQLGKREVARQFAKAILCYEKKSTKDNINNNTPCEKCESCLEFDKKTHPDFYWITKASTDKNIGVGQIRELKNSLANRSFFNSYKVAVVDGAHELSMGAANGLLKTLEEPLGKTVIILIAEKLNSLPATIISRTQKIKFLPVAKKDIYDFLMTKNLDRDLVLHVANLANGRPGRALGFINNPEAWSKYLVSINYFFKIFASKKYEKIALINSLLSEKKLIDQVEIILPLLDFWQMLFRDILLLKLEQSDKIINSKAGHELERLANYFSLEKLLKINTHIEIAKSHLAKNVNVKLILENFLLA